MKIKIETYVNYKDLHTSVFANKVMSTCLNAVKIALSKDLESCECRIHRSESRGSILLACDDDSYRVLYRDFCCDEFIKDIKNYEKPKTQGGGGAPPTLK